MKNKFLIKKGITLVELLIVLALLGIVIAGGFQFFFFGNNTFKSGVKQYDLQSDLRIASDVISNSVRYAANLEIISGSYDPVDFKNPASTYFGYDYIYLEYSGTTGVAIKKLSYNAGSGAYDESTIAVGESASTVFNLIFKNGDSSGNKNLLSYQLDATDLTKLYKIDSKVNIMNAGLGKVEMTASGSAIRYRAKDGIVVNKPPTAAPVEITGLAVVGQTLEGSYYYFDEDGDAEGATSFQWWRDGTIISGETSKLYTVSSADLGRKIYFEVTPRASAGAPAGEPEKSLPTPTVVAAGVNTKPRIENIRLDFTYEKDSQKFTIDVKYDFVDDIVGADNNKSEYKWYTVKNGAKTQITGDTTSIVLTGNSYNNTDILCEVYPKDGGGLCGDMKSATVQIKN